jgi:YD repeat-containing protein
VERRYYAVDVEQKLARLTFPRFVANSEEDKNFVNPGAPLTSRFLLDIMVGSTKVIYTLDNKQRVVTETYRDEEDNVIGELANVWDGSRIKNITWISEGDKRFVEYTYNSAGDRISEKDYKDGILERSVVIDGDKEDETIYLYGKIVLRASWESGKKISEKRVY